MKTSKRSLMSLAVAVGLAVVVNGGGVVHAQRQALPAGPSNTTYQVTVVSSFGTTFTDCFRFDTPGMGDLTNDGLGPSVDALNRLNGEAVNEFGDTFVFTGMSNNACPTGPSPLNPYLNQSTSGPR